LKPLLQIRVGNGALIHHRRYVGGSGSIAGSGKRDRDKEEGTKHGIISFYAMHSRVGWLSLVSLTISVNRSNSIAAFSAAERLENNPRIRSAIKSSSCSRAGFFMPGIRYAKRPPDVE
jgi:hypothetical protein